MDGEVNDELNDVIESEIGRIVDEMPWENQTTGEQNYANSYVKELIASSDLKILQTDRVNRAYSENGYCGLFKLFLTRSFLDKMRKWMNLELTNDALKPINEAKFNAYLGLEIAMSLVQFNDIDEYWKGGMFQGHSDFKKVMSRDDYTRIRSHVRLRPPRYSHDAVPVGTSALDQNTLRTTARTRAKTYLPNKPQPYGIRFYAVVGSKFTYLHSMFDNGSGNNTGISRPQAYAALFRNLRTPYVRQFSRANSPIDINSPTALWVLQFAHQVKIDVATSEKRVVFTDNFYTRHVLASELYQITDGKVRLTGTVKYTNVDAINRIHFNSAIQTMKDAQRGHWILVQAFDKSKHVEKMRQKHNSEMKKLAIAQRVAFVPPHESIANCAGYIVWRDSKVVVFYTNDLHATPSTFILRGNTEEAIRCVHGLEKLQRWTGIESLHRTTLNVPAPIVAYNLFMNSVDRMDQRRSTNPTRRVEKRLYMSIFTLYLDLAVHNAFALFLKLDGENARSISFREFKRQIAQQLVSSQINAAESKRINKENTVPKTSPAANQYIIGTTSGTNHMSLENKGKKDANCFLCMLRWKIDSETKEKWIPKLRTIYGCTECKKGFHVNCFSAYHHEGALKGDTKALMDIILGSTPEKL